MQIWYDGSRPACDLCGKPAVACIGGESLCHQHYQMALADYANAKKIVTIATPQKTQKEAQMQSEAEAIVALVEEYEHLFDALVALVGEKTAQETAEGKLPDLTSAAYKEGYLAGFEAAQETVGEWNSPLGQ